MSFATPTVSKPPKVNQPTAWPTNKLTFAAAVGPAAAELWSNFASTHVPELAGPYMTALVGSAAALLVGYFVRDRANVATDRSK